MSRKPQPLPMTDEEIEQHNKALIEYATWCGSHGKQITFHAIDAQRAYEIAQVLS